MISLLIISLATSADPLSIPAETIYAALHATAPHTVNHYNGATSKGRIYTLTELIRRFGPPSSRTSTAGNVGREVLTWERQDGITTAIFSTAGYDNPSRPATIRLRISIVTFERKYSGDSTSN